MGILEDGIGNVNHVMIKLKISINCIVYKFFRGYYLLNDQRRPAFCRSNKTRPAKPGRFISPARTGPGTAGISRAGGTSLVRFDLTELPGLDDLHNPAGPIAAAQDLAAKFMVPTGAFSLLTVQQRVSMP